MIRLVCVSIEKSVEMQDDTSKISGLNVSNVSDGLISSEMTFLQHLGSTLSKVGMAENYVTLCG